MIKSNPEKQDSMDNKRYVPIKVFVLLMMMDGLQIVSCINVSIFLAIYIRFEIFAVECLFFQNNYQRAQKTLHSAVRIDLCFFLRVHVVSLSMYELTMIPFPWHCALTVSWGLSLFLDNSMAVRVRGLGMFLAPSHPSSSPLIFFFFFLISHPTQMSFSLPTCAFCSV